MTKEVKYLPWGVAVGAFLAAVFLTLLPNGTITETVLISDRMAACEASGGQYSMFTSTYDGEKSERCEVQQRRITDY